MVIPLRYSMLLIIKFIIIINSIEFEFNSIIRLLCSFRSIVLLINYYLYLIINLIEFGFELEFD